MSTTQQPAEDNALTRTNRAILRAAVVIAAASLLVKLVAVAKEMAVASAFGRRDALDAFLAAQLLPSLLVNLIAESMNQVLVPTLVRVRELEGPESAQRLLASAIARLAVMLAAVIVLMLVLAPLFVPLISSNFNPSKRALAQELFCALLPMVLLSGMASTCTAVLSSRERFLWPTLTPAAVSLTLLAALLLGGARNGIWTMVWATLAGTFLQTLLVAALLQRHGYRFNLRWQGASAAIREVGRQYWPVLASSVVASSGLLVDQAMAASLAPGSVSSLVYANRFVSVVLTLLAGAISTAVVPSFARMVAHRAWTGCRRSARSWVYVMLAVSTPLALALIFAARWLVSATLEHGAFGTQDATAVTQVLAMYALQIPFYVASRVDYRLIVAARRTDLVLRCGIVNLVLDVALNLLLMHWMGVAGIALATSLWTVSTFLFLRYWAERLLRDNEREAAATDGYSL